MGLNIKIHPLLTEYVRILDHVSQVSCFHSSQLSTEQCLHFDDQIDFLMRIFVPPIFGPIVTRTCIAHFC